MKSTLSKSLFFCLLLALSSCGQQTLEIKEQDISPIVSMQKLAYVYYNMKRYAKSIEVYKKIIALAQTDLNKYDEDLVWAYYETGFCLLVQNKFKEALPYFKKILDNYSIYPDAYILSKDRVEEIRVRSKGKITLASLAQEDQAAEAPKSVSPSNKE